MAFFTLNGSSFHFRKHLLCSLMFAFCAGVLIGSGEFTNHLIHKNFEWYELYLSILVPTFFLAPVFFLLGSGSAFVISLTGRAYKIEMIYIAVTFWLFLVFSLELIAVVLICPDLALDEPPKVDLLILLFIVSLFLLVLACRSRLVSSMVGLLAQRFRNYCLNLLWFFAFFCAACLVTDVFLTYRIPKIPENPNKRQGVPNIILITLDTVRADHLTPYGYQMDTSPVLNELAKQSVVFDNAVSTTSWTLAAHASLMTGKLLSHHKTYERHQKLEGDNVRLAQILKTNGYKTAAFVGAPYCKARYGFGPGFDSYSDRLDFFEYSPVFRMTSFERLVEFFAPGLWRSVLGADRIKTAPEINKEIFLWLKKNGEDPFFLFINYFDAHAPYDLGGNYLNRFTAETGFSAKLSDVVDQYYEHPEKRFKINSMESRKLNYLKALYDSEIYFLDYHIGKLLDHLRQQKLYNNTLLVITADHGEEFLDHGGLGHKQTLYREMIHVPLLVHYPRKFTPKRVSSLVGINDIFATLLEFLKIKNRFSSDSISFLPLLSDGAEGRRDHLLSELYEPKKFGNTVQYALSRGTWVLIDVKPEKGRLKSGLFNHVVDEAERVDLSEKYGEQLLALRAILSRVKKSVLYF